MIAVYNAWRDQRYSEDWANQNLLQVRSLRQTRNIKEQLHEYRRKIDFARIEKYFSPETVEGEAPERGNKGKQLRKALAEGFFMNTVRKIGARDGAAAYLKVGDGLLARLDSSCAFELSGNFPDWAVFTEITGGASGNRGTMRMASEIRPRWVENKIPLLNSVDMH